MSEIKSRNIVMSCQKKKKLTEEKVNEGSARYKIKQIFFIR